MLLGGRKGIRPVKVFEWWGAGVVICLERGADLHMAQLMLLPLTASCIRKIQIGFTFLVPARPDSPEQRSIRQVCVRCCYHSAPDTGIREAVPLLSGIQWWARGEERMRPGWSQCFHSLKCFDTVG